MRDLILRVVARALIPFVIMYGLYVIVFGHVSPGGGFSGGATLGAGLILYRLTYKGAEVDPGITINSKMKVFSDMLEHKGMMMQAITGLYTFLIGIIFLIIIFPVPISLHGNWFNVANGFKVALSLVKLFYLLSTLESEDGKIGSITKHSR
ncbi:MnhB domain-containing protein [Natranaerobius thermophilus]|uniref:Na+/H+ antiporter MnhB subunit-related protein n=1 Tax=Natranaerobius thermophilus (strain ATCC BAA-1301 / DSM 18059 / JW/NM-WN-LF) TaxID=457570 RepID=B2A691_NATTJ|nr:MnhB domain-containing protein [Natranaerobius thermophilus]ACB84102.1 Na+/H+ antiporter MnhB subunit-related protein [Natranaerobius thermophilus JW/NM-WN-LF]